MPHSLRSHRARIRWLQPLMEVSGIKWQAEKAEAPFTARLNLRAALQRRHRLRQHSPERKKVQFFALWTRAFWRQVQDGQDAALKRRLRIWKNHLGNLKRFQQYNQKPEG